MSDLVAGRAPALSAAVNGGLCDLALSAFECAHLDAQDADALAGLILLAAANGAWFVATPYDPEDEGAGQFGGVALSLVAGERRCRECGCTEGDCSGCIERSGAPCGWAGPDHCTACADGFGPTLVQVWP